MDRHGKKPKAVSTSPGSERSDRKTQSRDPLGRRDAATQLVPEVRPGTAPRAPGAGESKGRSA